MSSDEVMDDHEFLSALEQLHASEDSDVAELLKMMNENRIISWEEAEQILGDTQAVVKSSLPEQTRPSEPDNDTDIERCVQQLNDNDPNLKKINLNNMKRTPIPSIKRLIEAVAYNTVLEELSLANLGLYDTNCEMLPAVLEINTTLKKLNLETNYLSGDFFAKLFKASCVNQTLEEVKAVNQGVSFATTAEKEIIDSILENRGLIKISLNLRLPEGRHKIENATLRNGEIKRVLRREAAARAKKEAEEAAKKPKPEAAPAVKKPAAVPSAAKPTVPTAKPAAVPKSEPKPEPVQPKPEPKIAPAKPEPAKPKLEPKIAPAKPEPKPEPAKPKVEPKIAPAKPEPKPEPKAVPKPLAAKPKAASPPKEETKPVVKKPIFPKKTVDPVPLPERRTLPVTTRSTSSRTSFLKEQLEVKAKEGEKKPVRKVVRKIRKPIESTTESTESKGATTVRGKETNGKVMNGGEKEETKKEVEVNGKEKKEEIKERVGSNTDEKSKEEEKKENGEEKKEVKKRTVVKKVLRKKVKKEEPTEGEKKEEVGEKKEGEGEKKEEEGEKKEEEGEKKEEEGEKKTKEEEVRSALGDDYLTTRPRRRSSAIQEVEIPSTPVKEEKPMAVYKLKRESRDNGPATTLEKGAAAPSKPIPAWKMKA